MSYACIIHGFARVYIVAPNPENIVLTNPQLAFVLLLPSLHFCVFSPINYVICSPFRVCVSYPQLAFVLLLPSLHFCAFSPINYVICSPFRVCVCFCTRARARNIALPPEGQPNPITSTASDRASTGSSEKGPPRHTRGVQSEDWTRQPGVAWTVGKKPRRCGVGRQ